MEDREWKRAPLSILHPPSSVLLLSNLRNPPYKIPMARLRDVAPVLRSFGTWAFLKRVWQQVNEDGIFVWASALAYSWLFACFPFLIFLMSLVPLLPLHAQKTAANVVDDVVHHTLPAKAVPIIMDNIDAVMNSP